MFCENCGEKIKDDIKFCNHCGASTGEDLTDSNKSDYTHKEVNQQAPTASVKQPMSKKKKVTIISICSVFAVIIACYFIGSWIYSPKRLASNYTKAMVEQDYDKLYGLLDIPAGDFTTIEQFKSTMERSKQNSNDKLLDMKVNDLSTPSILNYIDNSNDNTSKNFQVIYKTKNNESTLEQDVPLKKLGKALLFFDNYKVNSRDYIVSEYKISAPKSAQVKFDDIDISAKFTQQNGNSSNYIQREEQSSGVFSYKFKNIFKGKHNVSVVSPLSQDSAEEVEILGTGEKQFDLKLKDDMQLMVNRQTEDILKVFYTGIANKKAFADIQSQIKISQPRVDVVKLAYEALYTEMQGDGGIVHSDLIRSDFRISEFEKKQEVKVQEGEKPVFSYALGYKLNYNVTAAPGYYYWNNGQKSEYKNITVDFIYENGELYLNSIKL